MIKNRFVTFFALDATILSTPTSLIIRFPKPHLYFLNPPARFFMKGLRFLFLSILRMYITKRNWYFSSIKMPKDSPKRMRSILLGQSDLGLISPREIFNQLKNQKGILGRAVKAL